MGESLVGLGHFVHVIPFPDGIAGALGCVENLGGKGLLHGDAFPGVRVIHEPAHGQRRLTVSGHFQGDLICGATDTAGFDFQTRLRVIEPFP